MGKVKLTKEERKELRKEIKAKREGFFSEFKKFITRGNVVDMAVGVIVGSAFSKIVTTLTNSIIMPGITWLLKGLSVEEIKTVLRPQEINEAGEVIVTEIALNWGLFLQTIIDFLLIALVVFTLVKVINGVREKFELLLKKVNRKEEEEKQLQLQKQKELQLAQQAQKALDDKNKAETTSTNALLVEIINLLQK